MSLVAPSEIATYLGLGIGELDTARAQSLIDMTEALAGAIVSPLLVGAKAVIISAVVRAYTNPLGVTNESVGPYQAGRPSGGVYLTKGERAALRRSGGGSGAFSYDTLPTGYPEATFP